MSRRLSRLLRDGGAEDVRTRATARVTQRGDYYHTFLLTLCGLLRDGLLAAGRLTAAELDRHVADLRDHLDAPHTLTCQPLMWQAWGRKPR